MVSSRGKKTMNDSGGKAQTLAEKAYYGNYPITNPAYNVMRIAGRQIRIRAKQHFSGRLLEIGCGTKAKAALVGDLVTEHLGLDHVESPHDQTCVDLVGDAHDIPAPDDSFDCVLSTAVLEHLEEPQLALKEACRVLRPGGVGVYTAPLFWHIHEAPRDFYRYTEYGLHHLFTRAGFELVEITPLSGFWTTVAAQSGYYVQRFRVGPVRILVDAFVALTNLLGSFLDRGPLRDERFTWMYLVVARKPVETGSEE